MTSAEIKLALFRVGMSELFELLLIFFIEYLIGRRCPEAVICSANETNIIPQSA